jgi:hypothetical protein
MGSTVDLDLVDSGPFGLSNSDPNSRSLLKFAQILFLLFLFCLSHVLFVNLNHGLF